MRGPIGAHIMDRLAHRQHLVGGFVTNVPGPAGQLHLAGAPVTQVWPVPVLAANVRVGFAAVSYNQQLFTTVHYDADHVRGDTFAEAMHDTFTELIW